MSDNMIWEFEHDWYLQLDDSLPFSLNSREAGEEIVRCRQEIDRATWAEARAEELADALRDALRALDRIGDNKWHDDGDEEARASLARYDAGPDGGEEE